MRLSKEPRIIVVSLVALIDVETPLALEPSDLSQHSGLFNCPLLPAFVYETFQAYPVASACSAYSPVPLGNPSVKSVHVLGEWLVTSYLLQLQMFENYEPLSCKILLTGL